jgi:TonB family protein
MTGLLTLSNLLAWSLQVTLVVAVAFAALALLRADAPALRHAFLRMVLLGCLLLPVVQPWQPVRPSPANPGAAMAVESAVRSVGAVAEAPRRPSPTQLFDTYAPPAVAIVMSAGLLARAVWMLAGIRRLRRLRHAGVPASASAYDELQRIIGVTATIRWVRGLGQPVTFGFRVPVVLLPDSLAQQPLDIQRAVVAHELWHVQRRDWLWTVVEEALRAVFWWHPAIWILLSRIQGTREEVVDRLAIEATGSRRTYVDALLTYAGESPLCGSTAFGRRRHLIQRLVLISTEAVMSARRVVACGAILAVVTAVSGWYAVHAFPIAQVVGWPAGDPFSEPPGPVEQRAKAVTPENPIPRRTHVVPPHYPPEAAEIGARGTASVRVTLDEYGQLAEARLMSLSVRTQQPNIHLEVRGPDGARTLQRMLAEGRKIAASAFEQQRLEQVFGTLAHAAVAAVRQWQYDPPGDGPISFTVVVPFGRDPAPAEQPGITVSVRPDAPSAAMRSQPGFDAPPQGLGPDGALRVGGNIKAPAKIRHVNPEYPIQAMASRVSGVVILECRIEPDGSVSDVRVLRSIPLLDDAAVAAVQQWEFTPTLLNGAPVPVIMTVTVGFSLNP